MRFLERRVAPTETRRAVIVSTVVSVLAALVVGGALFLPFGANPVAAYGALLGEAFLTWRGFAFTLINAAPLILVVSAPSSRGDGIRFLASKGVFWWRGSGSWVRSGRMTAAEGCTRAVLPLR